MCVFLPRETQRLRLCIALGGASLTAPVTLAVAFALPFASLIVGHALLAVSVALLDGLSSTLLTAVDIHVLKEHYILLRTYDGLHFLQIFHPVCLAGLHTGLHVGA